MKLWQAVVVSAALLVITPLSHADPVPTVHCAPDENLEHIDVEIIDTAKSSVGAVARSSKGARCPKLTFSLKLRKSSAPP
jgi:hypothetical protein